MDSLWNRAQRTYQTFRRKQFCMVDLSKHFIQITSERAKHLRLAFYLFSVICFFQQASIYLLDFFSHTFYCIKNTDSIQSLFGIR